MGDSSDTDATSQSSASPGNRSIKLDIENSSGCNKSTDLPWILHRILECQLSCELPLRMMFAFNSGQKLPSLRQAHRWWQHGKKGKLIIKFISSQEKITPSLDDTSIEDLKNPPCGPTEAFNPDHHPKDRFMDQGNDVLLDVDFPDFEHGRRQSEGMPPIFVQNWCLNQVFTADYENADFAQALAGLDYIRDLEITRRASLREAAQRLCITKENWRDVLATDPDAKKWVENMQTLEIDISNYYANIFLNLRVWTIISELQSAHFYKPNLLAMLNTLFPPCVKELPNDKIDKAVLHKHRAHLYRYILEVEKNGPSVLKHFVEDLLRPGTKHSWPETRHSLEQYFERADNMITASTAIHDIRFFRYSAKCAPPTPSLSDRPTTSESGSTVISSQRSHTSQDSVGSTTEKSLGRIFDSSKLRQRIYSRHKISTPADQKYYFEPADSPWGSQQTLRNSGKSGKGLLGASRNRSRSNTQESDSSSMFVRFHGTTVFGSITPRPDAGSLRSRTRAESRAESPLIVQGSEAAQHESFTRPITPFADKRREVIMRRETISGRSASFELSPAVSSTPEMESYYNPRLEPGSRKTSSSVPRPPLGNDNFEFLNRPYQPPTRPLPSIPSISALKKVSSIGNFFIHRKSSVASRTTIRDNVSTNSENALGIEMIPLALRSTKSIETFSRLSQDTSPVRRTLKKNKSYGALEKSTPTAIRLFPPRTAPSIPGPELIESTETLSRFSEDTETRPRTLKKQISYGALEQSVARAAMHSFRTRAPTAAAAAAELVISELAEDAEQLKRMLKSKASLPNLRSKRFYEKTDDGGIDHFFVGTGDEYERYRHVPIPRPAPTPGTERPAAKKEVRKAKSFASLRPWATNDAEKTIRPRKSSLFRREPQQGERIRGKTISEPFPMDLQKSPALLDPESRSKEYTRKWFIEEGRAQRYGLIPPEGDPIQDSLHVDESNKVQLPDLLKKRLGKEEVLEREFEMPRATPIPLIRPDRQRWDSIFPRRAPPRPKKAEGPKNYVAIDLEKYTRYSGKQTI